MFENHFVFCAPKYLHGHSLSLAIHHLRIYLVLRDVLQSVTVTNHTKAKVTCMWMGGKSLSVIYLITSTVQRIATVYNAYRNVCTRMDVNFECFLIGPEHTFSVAPSRCDILAEKSTTFRIFFKPVKTSHFVSLEFVCSAHIAITLLVSC